MAVNANGVQGNGVKYSPKKKIVITGGGLVGALCACVLSQKGHHVELYEARSDPRLEEIVQGRSINLALSARGRAALRRAGLEDFVLSQGIPMRGRMVHSNNGSTKTILYDPNTEQCIYSVSRQFLHESLITEAETHPNVSVHFSHKLTNANVEKGVLTFRHRDVSGDESEVEVTGDILVGADGAHSAFRQAILKRPMTNFSQTYIDHAYMELRIPAKEHGQHAMAKNYLHIWPRNEFMLIALPNLDGSFTATLFMPIPIFNELKTMEDVDKFFSREFPDAMSLIGKELLISDFLASKPSHLISVKISLLHAGKGVLIGDAAHAMVPFYGQGMNAGFEDVLLLDDALEQTLQHKSSQPKSVERALANFSTSRVPNAHAIIELALYNYLEMRCLVNKSGFILRRFLDYKLHRIFGHRWTPLYNNVTFSQTPYLDCIEQKKWQDGVISKSIRMSWTSLGIATILSATIWRDFLRQKIHQVYEQFIQ